jgi:hypothetical protein
MPPLVPVTIAFLAGILVQDRWPAWLPGLLAAGALAGGAACDRRGRGAGRAALLTCWLVLGMARCAVWQRQPQRQLADDLPRRPAAVVLHAVVDEPPEPSAEAWSRGPVLRLLHRRTVEGWRPAAGRLRAERWPGRAAYGDEVLVAGEWYAIPAAGNPGEMTAARP